jgi:hypothetical protein
VEGNLPNANANANAHAHAHANANANANLDSKKLGAAVFKGDMCSVIRRFN